MELFRHMSMNDRPPPDRPRMQWSYDEAVQKLKQLLDLDDSKDESAKTAVILACHGDIDEDIEYWQFDYALRYCVLDDEDSGVSQDTLVKALLLYYLELQGVDLAAATNALSGVTGTSLEQLAILSQQGLLEELIEVHVRFFCIVESCTPGVQRLMFDHNHNLGYAIRGGYHTFTLSRPKARVAEFCLLTGLDPIVARAYQADKDLPRAVLNFLASDPLASKMRPSEKAITRIQAELFPERSSRADIEEAILAHPTLRRDSDFLTARDDYLVQFFTQQTNTSAATARQYLVENDWSMETATRKYRMKVLAPSALGHVDTFDTASPPYVEPNSIVVGLLGTVDDEEGNASPAHDGWFVSDFYLMKLMLRQMGHEQYWYTCLEPADLVRRYGSEDRKQGGMITSWSSGYVYGPAEGDRVVVLDQKTLHFAQKDLVVCEPKKLRSDYLSALDATFAKAQRADHPVVLLMFSHGDIEDTDRLGGLIIGMGPSDTAAAQSSDYLTATDITNIHSRYPKVRLTLYMTSCYSGHWVTTPYLKANEHVTVLAAARPELRSFSWKASNSIRHSGGIFTGAFADEIKLEPTDAAHAYQAREYDEFVQDVASALNGLLNPGDVEKGLGSLPTFSPAAANERFWERTGYPLSHYRQNYDSLTRIPPSKNELESVQTAGPVPVMDRCSDYGQTDNRLYCAVQSLVQTYENSYPTNIDTDHKITNLIVSFKSGEMPVEAMRRLQAMLTFRLGKCDFAMHIVKRLELWKGAATPISAWDPHQILPDRLAISTIAADIRTNTRWFKAEKLNDGYTYEKPFLYVANALHMQGFQGEQILQQIQKAKTILGKDAAQGSKRLRGDKSWTETMLAHRAGDFRVQGSPKKIKRASLAGVFPQLEDDDKEN